jgi:hypothetical protein
MKLNSGRIIAILCLALLILSGFGALQGAHPAHADTNLIYTVDANTAAGGVFARYGPHTNATDSVNGYGVYPSETVKLLCGVTDGDPVGPYNNKTWHFVTDLSNPSEGNFWLNDRYVDSPNVASQLAPGESTCPNESSNPLQEGASSNPAGHLPCTPLLLIGARGSGQSYENDGDGISGFGSTLAPIARALKAYYGSDKITTYSLPYTAVPANRHTILESNEYTESAELGSVLLLGILSNQTEACPQQIIELIGYSQGADAVNNAVSDMTASLRSHFGGVVTFGDPRFNAHSSEARGTFVPGYDGALGARPELPQDIVEKAQSYCNLGDAVCNFSVGSIASGNFGHSEYPGFVSIEAEFFLELLHPKSKL